MLIPNQAMTPTSFSIAGFFHARVKQTVAASMVSNQEMSDSLTTHLCAETFEPCSRYDSPVSRGSLRSVLAQRVEGLNWTVVIGDEKAAGQIFGVYAEECACLDTGVSRSGWMDEWEIKSYSNRQLGGLRILVRFANPEPLSQSHFHQYCARRRYVAQVPGHGRAEAVSETVARATQRGWKE